MSRVCFGVDLGGTTVKIGLLNEEGQLLDKWEIVTNTEDSGKNILPDIAASINNKIVEKNIDKNNIIGIGIGVPGPVNAQGVVYKCVNLGWGIVNVSEELGKLTGLPVKANNDANVAALGEMWQGGARGFNDVVMLTLGTGVGGGVIVNGEVVSGENGSAGELGHITIVFEDGEMCGCGKPGCLETVASATGIVRETKKYLLKTEDASVLRNIDNITAKDIFNAAKDGDMVAIKMVDQLGKYLGIASSYIANTLNPQTFVIGGGVSKAGQMLIDVITKHFKEYAFHSLRDTQFALATLENDAGMIGAAKLVLGK